MIGTAFESILCFRPHVIHGWQAKGKEKRRLAYEEAVEYHETHYFEIRNCASFIQRSA